MLVRFTRDAEESWVVLQRGAADGGWRAHASSFGAVGMAGGSRRVHDGLRPRSPPLAEDHARSPCRNEGIVSGERAQGLSSRGIGVSEGWTERRARAERLEGGPEP